MVNGIDNIYFERAGQLCLTPTQFRDEKHLREGGVHEFPNGSLEFFCDECGDNFLAKMAILVLAVLTKSRWPF